MASISGVSTTDINGIDGFFTTGAVATTSPTITALADNYGSGRFVVGNYSSYTKVSFECEVFVGSTQIVSNANITQDGATFTWVDSSSLTGTRTVKLRAQQFGDFIVSPETTDTYTKLATTFRYFKCRAVTSTGANTSSHMGIRNWRYTDTSSVSLPSIMTTDVLPTPFVATGGTFFNSTYAPFKAFDNLQGTWYWTLTGSAANNFLIIDMGASYTMASGTISFYSGSTAGFVTISGSLNGTTYTVINDTMVLNKTNANVPI